MSRIFLITLAVLALASAAGAGPVPQKSVENGIALELSVQPVSGSGPLREAQDVRVTLKVTDQLTGAPVTNLYPAGWMDRAAVRWKLDEEVPAGCKKKVESFLGGSMLSRPEVDLNVYYVLALNEDASISVVDPLFGYGNSRLLSMVFLASPGEDWVLSADGKRLFVSLPEAGRVASPWSTHRPGRSPARSRPGPTPAASASSRTASTSGPPPKRGPWRSAPAIPSRGRSRPFRPDRAGMT
jgi:hypothetical protein